VEVAFFFPWAAAYGKATHLMDPNFAVVESPRQTSAESALSGATQAKLTPEATAVLRSLGVKNPGLRNAQSDVATSTADVRSAAATLAKTSIVDILVFFAVLMVGFAYVWSRGDLDWVRAVSAERSQAPPLRAVGIDEGSETALAG
jgi:NADH-quinone oxidoreductase subunit A